MRAVRLKIILPKKPAAGQNLKKVEMINTSTQPLDIPVEQLLVGILARLFTKKGAAAS